MAGCSSGVNGVPFWGKLRAFMEQWETAPPRPGCPFDVSSASHFDELMA